MPTGEFDPSISSSPLIREQVGKARSKLPDCRPLLVVLGIDEAKAGSIGATPSLRGFYAQVLRKDVPPDSDKHLFFHIGLMDPFSKSVFRKATEEQQRLLSLHVLHTAISKVLHPIKKAQTSGFSVGLTDNRGSVSFVPIVVALVADTPEAAKLSRLLGNLCRFCDTPAHKLYLQKGILSLRIWLLIDLVFFTLWM